MAWSQLSKNADLADSTSRSVLPQNHTLAEIDMNIAALAMQERHTILVQDAGEMAVAVADIERRFREIQTLGAAYGAGDASSEAREFSSSFLRHSTSFKRLFMRAVKLTQLGKKVAAFTLNTT